MSAEANLKDKGITLPTPTMPLANYVGAVQTGNLLYLSGHGPLRPRETFTHVGKVGRELTVEQGYQVAREVGLNLLATARASLGSLDRVKRVVKVDLTPPRESSRSRPGCRAAIRPCRPRSARACRSPRRRPRP